MEEAMRYAGINVAQDWLDIAVHGIGQPWRVTSDEQGVQDLILALQEQGVAVVVVEATGGLEIPLAVALDVAGIPVALVNPRQVRDFSPASWASLPRPPGWTPRSWPTLGQPRGPCPGRSPMSRRGNWQPWDGCGVRGRGL